MKLSCILWVTFALVTQAVGGAFSFDRSPAPPEEERLKMEEATRSLIDFGKDLPALETLIANFKPEHLESIGINMHYAFMDPTREAAWRALLDWYSIDFLEDVMLHGSDDAAYWAMRKMAHQSGNRPSPNAEETSNSKRIKERNGIVPPGIATRLIPAFERLSEAKTERTKVMAQAYIERCGLLTSRERPKVLAALQQADEAVLNEFLKSLFARLRGEGPHLTEEIWGILARARTEALISACLHYPWLFELKSWDKDKTRVMVNALETRDKDSFKNADWALTNLALSGNPIATVVLNDLVATESELVKKRAEHYREQYRRNSPVPQEITGYIPFIR